VELHPIVVVQAPHEVARRCGEAALVQPDEADNIPVRRVGLPVRRRRDDPRRGAPFTFAASSPPFTSSFRANSVTVDRVQGRGSNTTIGWRGAIADESWKAREAAARGQNERGRSQGIAQLGRKGKKQGRRMLSGEVRDSLLPLPRFIDLGEPRSQEPCAPRALTAGDIVCR
jgi:hypothetical protein